MKRVIILFWLTSAWGFVVLPVVAIGAETAKGTPFPSALSQWIRHLFAPGYNEFLLALITALPFLVAAVFILFHLAAEQIPPGRWSGVAGALCAGAAVSLWGQIAIRMSRSSTAAIGYIFLPFEVLLVMLIGYIAGRLIAKLRSVPSLKT
jgi:hypothetical protein